VRSGGGVHGRRGGFSLLAFSCLEVIFLHCDGSGLVVDFLVEATSVADNVARCGSSPEGGLCGVAVATGGAFAAGGGHSGVLWLDERAVGAVHLVVEATGVAEVVARVVASPEGGGGGAAVHALTAFLHFLLRSGGGFGEGVREGGGADDGGDG